MPTPAQNDAVPEKRLTGGTPAEGWVARLGDVLNRVAGRIVPDPFVLALGLTVLVFLLGAWRLLSAPGEPTQDVAWVLATGWAAGFSSAAGLAFALQMSLVLVTGHALALSPPVQRFIQWIARVPRGAASAAVLVAVVSCLAASIHWGLGAIVGAFLAREVARDALQRGIRLHYPLLGAAAYAGFAVWHGGLSGSAPLKVAEEGHFVQELTGVVPLSLTLFASLNLIMMGALFIAIPLLFFVLTPRDPARFMPPDPALLGKVPPPAKTLPSGTLERFQEHPLLGLLVGLVGVTFVVRAVWSERLGFDLNAVILFFLFLGILFQGSLRRYVDTIADGARGAGAIILQFPFYFGILGVMTAGGLIEWISAAMIAASTTFTFPVIAFFSAGVVNLFVPSGGGQWAVQAHVLLEAGRAVGVSPATTVMAFAYGDAWTNMLQPFWALPLLGIMGLKARDIIGYTAMVFLLMLFLVPVILLIFG